MPAISDAQFGFVGFALIVSLWIVTDAIKQMRRRRIERQQDRFYELLASRNYQPKGIQVRQSNPHTTKR